MSTSALVVAATYPRKLQWSPASAPQSLITLQADIVPQEEHEDEMEITRQPIEQGSVVSDHAYKLPAELELVYGWSLGSAQNTSGDPGYLRNIYSTLLSLQAAATAFTIYTGKRIYKNMLIRGMREATDREHENAMVLHIRFQQALFAVTTALTLTAAAKQALPQKTAPVISQGPVSLLPGANYNSMLQSLGIIK